MTNYLTPGRLFDLTEKLRAIVREIEPVKSALPREMIVLQKRIPSTQTKRFKYKLGQLFVYRYTYSVVEAIPLGQGRHLIFHEDRAMIAVERESRKHFGIHLERTIAEFVYIDLTDFNRDRAERATREIDSLSKTLQRVLTMALASSQATDRSRAMV